MQAHRPGEILVVDGSGDFLGFASTILGRRGHAVCVCAFGAEARSLLERRRFDAVLCGYQLADGPGSALCSWIKSHEDLQGVPIALVGKAGDDANIDPIALMGRDAAPGAPFGVGPLAPDEFLALPLSAEEFVLRVGALLRLRRYREEIDNAVTTLLSVAEGIEEQDDRARGHCKRLAISAVLLGSCLGRDEWDLLTLERAGYVHDIGKSCIPGAILDKTQPLTPREMHIVREHPVLGERLCSPVMALRATLPIVRHHHERGDGTGYPDGLRADEIPFLAQLFSIVDVYDSLRTWRPYRPPLDNSRALEIMQQEVDRGLWNREIFEVFSRQVVPTLPDQLALAGVLWPGRAGSAPHGDPAPDSGTGLLPGPNL